MFTVGRETSSSSDCSAYVVDPMLDAEKFFCLGFVHAAGGFGDHFLFGLGEWASFCAVTFDGGIVAVGRDERGQCPNEMPGGTVESRFVAGVHVLARAAAPAFAARSQFAFDDAFRAEEHRHAAVEALRGEGHEHAAALF